MSVASIQQLEALALQLDPRERAELARRLIGATAPNKDPRPSLRDHRPRSVGRVLKPLPGDDDLLDEMFKA